MDSQPILWWNDDGVVLQCRREACQVEQTSAYEAGKSRMVWWEGEVTGLTLDQALKVHDDHLKEKHSVPVKGLNGEVIGTAYTPDNQHLLMEIGETAARSLGMIPDVPHVSFGVGPYEHKFKEKP